jgi:hypothetical protein
MTGTIRFDNRSRNTVLAVVAVCLAASLPYLSTVHNYFVRDDFGVVKLLASKPAGYFPRWFYTSWMDDIWGYVPDEVRPFPAVSYQLTALGGSASPVLHHVFNIALHAANGVLMFLMGRIAAGLSVPAAAFTAGVFVLLPVQAESVAWITGRVDSMPAFFYIASFLAYVMYAGGSGFGVPGLGFGVRRSSVFERDLGPASEARSRALYFTSLASFFVALFTKQTTITMIGTLVMWDLIVARHAPRERPDQKSVRLRPPSGSGLAGSVLSWSRILGYMPFLVLTVGYLGLRYALFGQVAREGRLSTEGIAYFGRLVARHLAHVVTGNVSAGLLATSLVLVAVLLIGWMLLRPQDAAARSRTLALLLFFGPIWWAIGVAPILVAGYESPRHAYLASAGWAVVLGILFDLGWHAEASRAWYRRVSSVASVLVLAAYGVELHGAVKNWNTMAAASHKAVVDTRAEALSARPGTLLILGAPVGSWEWAVPFSVQPPFTRVDLTTRVFVISPWLLSCRRGQWFDDTRRTLQAWRSRQGGIVVLRWDPETGALARVSDREYPALRSLVPVLLEIKNRDALAAAVLRIVNELAARGTATRDSQAGQPPVDASFGCPGWVSRWQNLRHLGMGPPLVGFVKLEV